MRAHIAGSLVVHAASISAKLVSENAPLGDEISQGEQLGRKKRRRREMEREKEREREREGGRQRGDATAWEVY